MNVGRLGRLTAAAAAVWIFACADASHVTQATDQPGSSAASSPAALLAEVRKSFTVKGQPIPPEIFRDFGDGDLADSGAIWITVDVLAATGSNMYYDTITGQNGSYSQKKAVQNGDSEETGYLYIGTTDNGLLVAIASYSGGGSGDFITLHILDLAAAQGLDNDGKPYQRINLTNIRSVALGDRWSGKVSIAKNTIHIAMERNGPGDRSEGPPGDDRSGAALKRDHDSYLNDSATRVRKAVTLPSSTFMSIWVTSATRRSRSELAAVSTARRPASSHDFSLTPTTSTTR